MANHKAVWRKALTWQSITSAFVAAIASTMVATVLVGTHGYLVVMALSIPVGVSFLLVAHIAVKAMGFIVEGESNHHGQ